MFDLGPKQSRYALIIAVLLYVAVMAGLFAWLTFKSEDTLQRRLEKTPSVTVTLAGKEPLVPESWKQEPAQPPAEKPAEAPAKTPEVMGPPAPEIAPVVTAPTEAVPAEKSLQEKTEEKAEEKVEPKPEAAIQPAAEAVSATVEPTAETIPDQTTPVATPAAPLLRWQRFARPFDKTNTKPRIAIIIADLGLASGATQAAVQDLPGEMTMAFSSSATDLESWIAKSRAAGHESLVTIPMEPDNYPQNDPGPNTLLTGLDNKENVTRVRWALARADGYVGIMPYMGQKFTTAEDKLIPVLDIVKAEGLIVVDNTMNRNSLIAPLSRLGDIPFTRSDAVIDLAASRVAIESQLDALEKTAAERGYAVGVALPYPVTFEKLKAWIPTLEAKGFVLAPITAVITEDAPPVAPAAMPPGAASDVVPSAPNAVSQPDPNRVANELVQ